MGALRVTFLLAQLLVMLLSCMLVMQVLLLLLC
jgi:hypothetical protein